MKRTFAMLLVLTVGIAPAFSIQGHDHTAHHQKGALQGSPRKSGAISPMKMAVMMRTMHASGARLDALVAKMDAAQGVDRIDANSEVIKALVAEHKAMMAMCHTMMMSSMEGLGGRLDHRHHPVTGHGLAAPKKDSGHPKARVQTGK